VKSDVWSTGISLIELALGRFPFAESSSDDSDLSDLEGTLSPSRPGNIQASLSGTAERKKKKGKVCSTIISILLYIGLTVIIVVETD
jgi:mitogen-activated protein kinase kinase